MHAVPPKYDGGDRRDNKDPSDRTTQRVVSMSHDAIFCPHPPRRRALAGGFASTKFCAWHQKYMLGGRLRHRRNARWAGTYAGNRRQCTCGARRATPSSTTAAKACSRCSSQASPMGSPAGS